MARAIAAALTPLRSGGAELDLDAFDSYIAFLQDAGIDGILALGTTGEGIALTPDERKRALEAFVTGPLPVIAHCGAQTTAQTVELCAHASSLGVDGVAVIAPPYFPLDEEALLAHFTAAARAAGDTPFYAYELKGASGYAIPPSVVERLRGEVSNVVGMKVSDAPFDAVRPYLFEGLAAGAAGAVSGLASAFPEAVVEAVRSGDSKSAGELRAQVERFPRHAALKEIVKAKGVPMNVDVRPPLRGLTPAERESVLQLI